MNVALILCAVSAAPALRHYEEWTLAETIEHAVARMGADAVPHVVRLLDDPRPPVRFTACRILARIGPDAKAAVPALSERLDDPEVASHIVEVLIALNRKEEALEFLAAAEEKSPENPMLQDVRERLFAGAE